MPLYAFSCATCGGFDMTPPRRRRRRPGGVPDCGRQGRRVFTPPGLARLATPLRGALDREEKSAHAPEVVSQKRGRPMPHAHGASPPWVLSH